MNYAQLTLLRELIKLQTNRRRHNFWSAPTDEEHWSKEFTLIKAIKILNEHQAEARSDSDKEAKKKQCHAVRCCFTPSEEKCGVKGRLS